MVHSDPRKLTHSFSKPTLLKLGGYLRLNIVRIFDQLFD